MGAPRGKVWCARHALAHEERAGACFAVLRGLSEHVAAEFRPLLDRLTLELQHAVYDRSALDESSHFAQLRHAREHAANVTVDLKAEREEPSRLRRPRGWGLMPLELYADTPPPYLAIHRAGATSSSRHSESTGVGYLSEGLEFRSKSFRCFSGKGFFDRVYSLYTLQSVLHSRLDRRCRV